MRHEILHRPSYALGVIHLESGERIQAEPGAMVSMSPTIHLETSTKASEIKSRGWLLSHPRLFHSVFLSQ